MSHNAHTFYFGQSLPQVLTEGTGSNQELKDSQKELNSDERLMDKHQESKVETEQEGKLRLNHESLLCHMGLVEEEMYIENSGVISSPEWMDSSKTSEIGRHQKLRPYFRSSKSSDRLISASPSGEWHWNNTQLTLNSLINNNNLLNKGVTMHQVPESRQRSKQQGPMVSIAGETMPLNPMQNNSFTHSIENSSQSVNVEVHQTCPTQITDQMTNKERERQTRRNEYTNPSSLGMQLKSKHRGRKWMRTARRQEQPLESSKKTWHSQNERSNGLLQPHKGSPSPNGGIFSWESLSTSMSSSAISPTLPLLRRMWAALEEQKSLLAR
jgi:hypothetical protein